MSLRLIVFCGMAGRHRANMQHPPVASYPLNHFTADELRDLRRDPVFFLAIGDVATEETLDELEAALETGGEAAEAAVEKALVSDARSKVEPGPRQGKRAKSA